MRNRVVVESWIEFLHDDPPVKRFFRTEFDAELWGELDDKQRKEFARSAVWGFFNSGYSVIEGSLF